MIIWLEIITAIIHIATVLYGIIFLIYLPNLCFFRNIRYKLIIENKNRAILFLKYSPIIIPIIYPIVIVYIIFI